MQTSNIKSIHVLKMYIISYMMKWVLTLCLLGCASTTFRARTVIEGRIAVQVVRNTASHTTGLMKAFNDAPNNTNTDQTIMFFYTWTQSDPPRKQMEFWSYGQGNEEDTTEDVVTRGSHKQTRAMKNHGGHKEQHQAQQHCSNIVLGPELGL